MKLDDEIKLKEMQHATWLGEVNHYTNPENYVDRYYDQALNQCYALLSELEELYKIRGMSHTERLAYLIKEVKSSVKREDKSPLVVNLEWLEKINASLAEKDLLCTHPTIPGIPCILCFTEVMTVPKGDANSE